jgi:phospholipid/cholesterol/gamma-HCH transport system substrate-binding protein
MAVKLKSIIRVIIICLLSISAVIFLYLLVNNFQFQRGTTFYIRFNHIGSLMHGAWIRKAGVKIGSITDIKIDESDQRTVIITFNLFPGQRIHKDSRFVIMSASMIGDQYIEVIPGTVAAGYAEEGQTFLGESSKSIDTLLVKSEDVIQDFTVAVGVLSEILHEKKDDIKDIISNIDEASASLNKVITNAEYSLMNLPKSIDEFSRAVVKISKYVDQINNSDTVFGLLKDDKVSKDLKAAISNLNIISMNLLEASEDMKEILSEIIGPDEQ